MKYLILGLLVLTGCSSVTIENKCKNYCAARGEEYLFVKRWPMLWGNGDLTNSYKCYCSKSENEFEN